MKSTQAYPKGFGIAWARVCHGHNDRHVARGEALQARALQAYRSLALDAPALTASESSDDGMAQLDGVFDLLVNRVPL